MTGIVRIGLVGCGRIAERGYLPALALARGVEPVAVADPDPGRRQAAAAATGVPAFASLAAMLERCRADAVVIAAPAAHHVALAAQAAAAALPALVEKPPAPSARGAAELAALDPQPFVGFNRRFLDGAALAAAVPRQGWVELDLELRFRQRAWGAHGGGDDVLLDAATHVIDLALFATRSRPLAVRAAREAAGRCEFELELGRARARVRCALDRRWRERARVRRGGRLLSETGRSGATALAGRIAGRPAPLVVSLAWQLEALAATLRGGDARIAPASAAEGVEVMRVVEAVRRSAALGGAEVTVPLPRAAEPVA